MTPSTVERLRELLADRAICVLGPSEEDELATLLAAHPGEDPHDFDRVAALLALADLRRAAEPMPPALERRLRQLGHAWAHPAG